MTQIFVFGDSIAWGAWDAEGGWVQRLAKYLHQGNTAAPQQYVLVYNLSVSGDSSREILKRFRKEVAARHDKSERSVVIFAYGSNDAWLYHKKKKFNVPPKQFEANTVKLIAQAKKLTKDVFFLGLDPVNEKLTRPLAWRKDISYENKDLQLYEQILGKTCKKYGVTFIPEFEKLFHTRYVTRLEDGVHPNSTGHMQLFFDVREVLQKKKIIR